MSILNKIQPAGDSPWIKMLIYGQPGTGKTVFSATAPNALILDAETEGVKSLNNHPELDAGVIPQFHSIEQLDEVMEAVRNGELDDFDTIVLDTVTEFQAKVLSGQLAKARAKDSSRNPYLAFQSDYRENTEMLRRKLNEFCDLPKHIIMTAHVVEDKDEETGALTLRPGTTPKLASSLIGLVSVQGYMTVNNTTKNGETVLTRTLQTMPTRRVKAKSRIKVPAIIENPKFSDFMV